MIADEYRSYLTRFDQQVGPLALGAYGKWRGRLVRKLSLDEFTAKQTDFQQLNGKYQQILSRGDTMNDSLTKLVQERAAELLLEAVR